MVVNLCMLTANHMICSDVTADHMIIYNAWVGSGSVREAQGTFVWVPIIALSGMVIFVKMC